MNDPKLPDEFDPTHARAHGYTREDWDDVHDNPEWTREDFEKAKPFSEVEPALHASLMRDRAATGPSTEAVSIPFDRDVLQKLRASRPDWPRRVSDMVRRTLDAA